MPQTTIYVSPRSLGAPDSRPPAVHAVGVARLFAGSVALADVTLEVDAGRVIALSGPNGAGKTTLLRILATAIRPSFGTLAVDGYDTSRHADLVRARVAFLSHHGGLYDDLTARENLIFAATMLGTPDPRQRVETALADVELGPRADDRVRVFSAGMRRRVALARILLGAPSLVLLDEPYAALDADGIALVDDLLAAWRAAGATVLVASHATERLAALCDGVALLDGGVVRELRGAGVRVPVGGAADAARGRATIPAGAASAR